MNEFHARICDAQIQTNLLTTAQAQFPNLCSSLTQATCVIFPQYATCYYNQNILGTNLASFDYLPLIILASILALLWLIFALLCCCCMCFPNMCFSCCCCCPFFCRNFRKKFDSMTILDNRSRFARRLSQKNVSSIIRDYPGFNPTKFDTHSQVNSLVNI